MGYFNKNNQFGNKRSFGGRRSFGGGGRGGDRQMYQAVCSECGKDCEVPFRPSGEKPVLCSQCFGKSSGNFDDRRPSFHRDNDRLQNNVQLDAISAKLDRILEILTKGQ